VLTALLLLACGPNLWAAPVDDDAAADDFFTQKIEPILQQRCLGCHSHAAGEMEGELALDSASGWQVGGSRGTAIVPGNPDASLFLQAVRRSDPDFSMPPDDRLSAGEIQLLTEWIERGAADPRTVAHVSTEDPRDWWSLRPLVQPQVPAMDEHGQNPLDAFLNQRLQAAGISATPRADRRALIRRLTFDLHGLQPTPEDVDAFVANDAADAYENLVDRLLASPRYAERWARHWLDAVHFADSHGCEHDVFRPHAWRYRDYVISAFHNDTPWPRFIREQLAADHFFPEDTHLTAGLGFIAAGPLELSRASTAPITFDYLDRDDMVNQTMAAFASTTANCARCHNHKFDPVTQADYYSLQAVFAGIGKGDVAFDADANVGAERRHWTELANADLATHSQPADPATTGPSSENGATPSFPDAETITARWEERLGDHIAVWTPLHPAAFVSSDGATLKLLDDHSILATGERPDSDTYTITAPLSIDQLTAVRLDVLPDDSLPFHGPGRCDNGNLHLTEASIFVNDTESQKLKIRSAVADWDQAGWTIDHALDGDLKTAWGIYPKVGESHHAVFEFETPLDLKPDSQITIVLKQLHGGSHLIGRLKLHVTATAAAAANVLPQSVAEALKTPPDQRTPAQHSTVTAFAVKSVVEQKLAALPAQATVYGVSNLYSRAVRLPQPMVPAVVHVLKRGNIDQPGAVAVPGSLSAITELPGRFELPVSGDEPLRRAALADWLAARQNPLTWRSVVNRVWGWHFGRAVCDTPNDFGRMGGIPSHPELLDWLAVWFRDDAGGSMKKLHRLILLSDAYQRASASDGVPVERANANDSDNRLLWRSHRRRMDAESFRDSVLQISGRLDLTMSGPGIQQFSQTKGPQATPTLDYDAFDWNAAGAGRRSIYRVVWRGIADPFMESLDFPDLGLLAPKREFSVSALQALAMYNNDFVLHHSQALADNVAQDQASREQQILQVVRLLHLRKPSDAEVALLTAYSQQHGLAATCRILFNSNEFLFIE